MAGWTDLPEEVKDIILDFRFQGKVTRCGAHSRDSERLDEFKCFQEVTLFFVSKTFFRHNAIIDAMLRSSTLLIDDLKNLTKVQAVLQPWQLQHVKMIQTEYQHSPNTTKVNIKKCSFGPQSFKEVFPKLTRMDIKLVPPHNVNNPIITVSKRPTRRSGQWHVSIPGGVLISSFIKNARNEASQESHASGYITEATQVAVAYLGGWCPITSFLQKILAGNAGPLPGNTVWFALLKQQCKTSGVKVRLLVDTDIAKGRKTVEQMGVIKPTFADSSFQQASFSLIDLVLKFQVDQNEIEVPQLFTDVFLGLEAELRNQYEANPG